MFFATLELREVLSMSSPATRAAIGALLPGPVTLVIANPRGLYPLACRDDRARLGVRLIEGHLQGARCAVFQTSANRSGAPATARFGDVDEAIVAGVDLAIDGGELGGSPSTVVDLTAIDRGEWSLLREGALTESQTADALARAAGTRDGA
jgi:L-threonylcarbamoyladenylate synthase